MEGMKDMRVGSVKGMVRTVAVAAIGTQVQAISNSRRTSTGKKKNQVGKV